MPNRCHVLIVEQTCAGWIIVRGELPAPTGEFLGLSTGMIADLGVAGVCRMAACAPTSSNAIYRPGLDHRGAAAFASFAETLRKAMGGVLSLVLY
jgi:glutaminase